MNTALLSKEAELFYTQIFRKKKRANLNKELEEQYSTLAIQIRLLGINHDKIAFIFNSIARSYIGMGEYYKALTHLMTAKEIREKVLGKDHPETIDCCSFIGLNYYMMKEYAQAEFWLQQATEKTGQLMGKKHPATQNVASFMDEITKQMQG